MKTIPIKQDDSFAPIDPHLIPPEMEFTPRLAKIARYIPIVSEGKNGAPISIQVALTDSCFNRCVMCEHPFRPQRSITAEEWLNFIDPLCGKVESVCYSGGDPMAHPDFNKIMKWHAESGMAFGMTISGFIPPRIDMELLAKAQWVRVSLDAITPEVYARVRGKTPVAKIIDGIDRMIAAGVNVELGVTVHKGNRADLDNVLAFADSRGIKNKFIHPIYPDSIDGEAPLNHRPIKPFESCSAVLYQLYIDADGSVYPCCITAGDTRDKPQADPLGNIRGDWKATWESVKEYSRRKKEQLPEICKTCCIQRLSEINFTVERAAQTKSFF